MDYEEIVERLIGEIRPIGSSKTDAIRLENLKAMCELANRLIIKIDEVAYDFQDSRFATMRIASEYASDFLTNTIGIPKD